MSRDRAIALALAVLALALVGPRVVGFTTDSDAYLDVAANLHAGRGLVQTVVDFWRPAAPDPLGLWPPLYPLAVAALSATGLALEMAARAVAVLGFLAFALALHALARRAGGRGFALVAVAVALALPAVARLGATAWSESLYLALATAGVVAGYDLSRGEGGAGRALLAGVALGLAADTRYLGLALVPVVLLLLAFARVRARLVGAWAVGVAAVVGPWLAHGLIAFGRPLGPPLPHAGMAWPRVLAALAGAARWELLPWPLAAVVGLAAIALAGVAKAWLWAVRRPSAERWAACIALAQLGAVGVATARFGINDPGGRYAAVAWPFLVLVALAGADAALRHVPGGRERARGATVAGAAVALALAGAGLTHFVATSPAPPAAAAARDRDLAALRALLAGGAGPVLSDQGHLVRLASGRAAVQVPPPRFRLREFTAEDEARWTAAGVRSAIFRAEARGELGAWLARRTGGGPDAWAVEDSAGGFVRYRVAPLDGAGAADEPPGRSR